MMIQVMICVVFVVVLLDKDGEKMCVRVIYIVRKPEVNSKNMQPRLSLSLCLLCLALLQGRLYR